MPQERVLYIDALRGLAMIMVVYCHVEYFILHTSTPLYIVFNTVMLPIFFFVSGYAIRSSANYVNSSLKLWPKMKNLIVPTLVMGSLYVAIFGFKFADLFMTVYKLGYWFTFALAGMLIINAILVKLIVVKNLSRKGQNLLYISAIIITWLCMAIIYLVISTGSKPLNYTLDILSIPMISRYGTFFLLGIFVKTNSQHIDQVLNNTWSVVLLFGAFFALFYQTNQLNSLSRFIILVQDLAGVLAFYSLFKFGKTFANENLISKTFVIVGRFTLPIYLFHYFLIQTCVSLADKFCFFEPTNDLIVVLCGVSLEVIIISITLLVAKVTEKIPWLYHVLFGKLPYRKPLIA